MDAQHGDRSADRAKALRFRRRQAAPTNEVPVAAPVAALVARTDNVAVAVTGARTYSVGVEFDIAVRVREIPTGLRSTDLHRALHGHPDPDGSRTDARLLLGVEFADGRIADNLRGRFGGHDDDADRPTVVIGGNSSGGGPGRSFVLDARCWVTPVPPDGPLTLVVAWPALGLPDSKLTLPDLALATDSERVLGLWPEPEETTQSVRAPGPPDVPPGSWFAREDS